MKASCRSFHRLDLGYSGISIPPSQRQVRPTPKVNHRIETSGPSKHRGSHTIGGYSAKELDRIRGIEPESSEERAGVRAMSNGPDSRGSEESGFGFGLVFGIITVSVIPGGIRTKQGNWRFKGETAESVLRPWLTVAYCEDQSAKTEKKRYKRYQCWASVL
ncbi:hypothetical protein C8R43DRAFT_955874 [Mycena crocata]|nr:hypothetical protein C8R43DRAFT_955874 [Mycena crocata]